MGTGVTVTNYVLEFIHLKKQTKNKKNTHHQDFLHSSTGSELLASFKNKQTDPLDTTTTHTICEANVCLKTEKSGKDQRLFFPETSKVFGQFYSVAFWLYPDTDFCAKRQLHVS